MEWHTSASWSTTRMGETIPEPRDQTALIERLLDRERDRNDRLLEQQAAILGRIEARLSTIETRIGEALTPSQWAKALAGIGLPIAALWLTGNPDIAKSLLPH